MSDQPAMTMREIREALGHVEPGQPEPIVEITRYEVSVLPRDDINRRYFTLTVELTSRGEWIVHDGHGGYDADGTWTQGRLGAHGFADYDDAIALARRLAPNVTVNGHTALDADRRTHPAP